MSELNSVILEGKINGEIRVVSDPRAEVCVEFELINTRTTTNGETEIKIPCKAFNHMARILIDNLNKRKSIRAVGRIESFTSGICLLCEHIEIKKSV